MDFWQSLPADFRTTVILCLCGAAPLVALFAVGRLITWRRKGSLLPLALAAGGAIVMGAALSLYLDRQPTLPGVVEDKAEAITVDDANWSHTVRLSVRFTPPGEAHPRSDWLNADPKLYDQLQIGDAVNVRYLHLGGWFRFARISDRTTLSLLLGSDLNLVWGVVSLGLLMLIGLTQGRTQRLLVGLLIAVGLPIGILLEPMHQLRTAAPLVGAQAETTATVVSVTRVTQVGGGDDTEPDELWQPVDLVEVQYVPRGHAGPVRGADLVDADSLTLEAGGQVSVRYLTSSPRTVQLVGGSRSYGLQNSIGLIVIPVATLALLLILGLWAWLRRAHRERDTHID